MGAPASGKGTISTRIVSQFDFNHISSGDLLRWNIEKGTGAGKKADEYMRTGELVPDNVVIACMLDKIDHEPHPRILLDGFPRVIKFIALTPLILLTFEIPCRPVLKQLPWRRYSSWTRFCT